MTASRLDSPGFRAAQANLNSSEAQRRTTDRLYREAAIERAKGAAATRRAHKAALRNEIKQLRNALAALPAVEDDLRGDSFYADPATLQGALEELDSQRECITNRLARVESDLRRA